MHRDHEVARRVTAMLVWLALASRLTTGETLGQRPRTVATQPAPTAWVHESWTATSGLPVNSVNNITQDRLGYIWVATLDGLARFDGERFTVYNASNSPGLGTNRLFSVREGRDATLWIRTESNDLVRLRAGRFTTLTRNRSDEVYGVLEDSARRIWVGTSRGIAVVHNDSITPVGRETLTAPIVAMLQRRDGSIWFGAEGRGLYRAKRAGGIEAVAIEPALIAADYFLYEDPSGTLWVGTEHGFWSGQERLTPSLAFGVAPDRVLGIYGSVTGAVFGLSTRGIYRLAPGTPATTVRLDVGLTSASGWTDGTSLWYATNAAIYRDGERVTAIPRAGGRSDPGATVTTFVDREGSIWVGTSTGGLHRFSSSLFATFSVPEGLAHENIYAVYADSLGGVWAGSWGAGISRIDARSGAVMTWRSQRNVPSYVFSFLGAGGRLWVGTNHGLVSCEPTLVACRRERPNELAASEVRALYATRAGAMWVGARDGLWRFDGGRWQTFTPRGDGAPDATVRVFATSRDGAVWMGTNGAGLARFADGRFTILTTADGMPNDRVRALYLDADGWLWVGTEGRGLARLDPRAWSDSAGGGRPSRRLITIGARDGLFDETIHTILEDDFGRLWMNTNRGIFWVPRAELIAFANGTLSRVHSTSYTERDGMRNREGNGGVQPAGAKTADGHLWFPTQDGVVTVDPSRVRQERRAPVVVIEDVLARGARVAYDSAASVRLTPDQRDLQIEYTAPTFLEPDNVRFRYRLEPYDADWVDAGNRRRAFYTKLPPGTYAFRVEASTEREVWNSRSAPLSLSVVPRFYETGVAKLLFVLALGTLLTVAVRWRLSEARRRELELTNLVDVRTAALREREHQLEVQNAQLAEHASTLSAVNTMRSRLFANLSHEFRTPLTLILGPLRGLLEGRQGELTPAVREQGTLMLRNGQRLLRLINHILDLARLQSGAVTLDRRTHDLVGLTRSLTLGFAPLAERRGIALRFAASESDALPASVDAEQFEKVILNLISNALKFTPRGGEVEVAVRGTGDAHAEIIVRDTGVGIAPADVPRVFERFYQADSSTTRRYEGTGIGLALARELVGLHGGDIRVESTVGHGSTFTVRIPLGVPVVAQGGVAATAGAIPMVVSEEHVSLTSVMPADDIREEVTDERTTVLVVDDNADVRAYVRSVLDATYRVIEAPDGRAGLDCARTMLPDLIVADVMMPELDGLAMARALKDSAMTDAIPVVLLTARASAEDQIAGLETGVDAYVVKPFDPGVLDATVANLLAQRRRLRERFRAGEVSASTPTVVPAEARSALVTTLRPIVVAHLTDDAFSPESLAAAAGMTYHQLYRALRDELHMTPSRFIRGVRVECASELLRSGAGSVTEVAYAVGFEALSHFGRAYRERFGVPPSAHVRSRSAADTTPSRLRESD